MIETVFSIDGEEEKETETEEGGNTEEGGEGTPSTDAPESMLQDGEEGEDDKSADSESA